jgi:signal transduction histidine kinase
MQLQDKGGISLSSAEEWQQATAIFESFTDGFITLDHEWCITYLNLQKHSNVSGLATEHLLGRRMWDVFPEAPGTIFEQQCREAAEKRVNVSFEVYYPPHTARYEVRIYPSSEGISIYFTDITVRKSNAYLVKQAQAQAILQERQRLARELHDSVYQELYGICLSATAGREALETEPTQSIAALERVILHADVGLAEIRALLFELRPELLETEGLVAALDKRAEVLRARYNLAVDVNLGEEPDISIESKHTLFRIAQESLHNITKHAHASNLTLRLVQEQQELVLEVRDNGKGFDPAGPFPGHFGLQSMHERAASLDGTISIESAPGNGTTVSARIPRIF